MADAAVSISYDKHRQSERLMTAADGDVFPPPAFVLPGNVEVQVVSTPRGLTRPAEMANAPIHVDAGPGIFELPAGRARQDGPGASGHADRRAGRANRLGDLSGRCRDGRNHGWGVTDDKGAFALRGLTRGSQARRL